MSKKSWEEENFKNYSNLPWSLSQLALSRPHMPSPATDPRNFGHQPISACLIQVPVGYQLVVSGGLQ